MAGILCAATLALAGCGGDDGDGAAGEAGNGVQGAEKTVKSYLKALVDGDGEAACGYLSDEYRQDIIDRNAEAARQLGATDCESFIRKVTQQATEGGADITFEGEPLTNASDVEGLDLKTSVEANLSNHEEDTAVVTGPQHEQRYELEVIDGRWTITTIR